MTKPTINWKAWTCTDSYAPCIDGDYDSGIPITSEERLRDILARFSKMPPRVITLRHTNGRLILVGTSLNIGAVEYYPDAQKGKGYVARLKNDAKDVAFYFTGEGQPARFKHLLSIDTAIDVAVLLTKGEPLPESVELV